MTSLASSGVPSDRRASAGGRSLNHQATFSTPARSARNAIGNTVTSTPRERHLVSPSSTQSLPNARTLKVAYVLTFDPSRLSGLWARLRERLEVWADHNIEADVLVCVRHDSQLAQERLSGPHRLHVLPAKRSFLSINRLRDRIANLDPDITYARYGLPWPGLSSLANAAPLIFEIHADETVERSHLPLSYEMVSRCGASRALRAASGFVFVDPALTNSDHLSRFQVPKLVLANGIGLDPSICFGSARPRTGGPPRLVMSVGAPEAWQGLDKLEELARYCPDAEFHVLGVRGSEGSERNVTYHGRLDPAEHDKLLHQMDVGIANLGLERIGREAASPLKVRDYIRAGLPVVLAHNDPDLPPSDPTVLDLGYGFSVSLDTAQRLKSFLAANVGRTCSQALADSVDVRSKEIRRISFMRELVENQ